MKRHTNKNIQIFGLGLAVLALVAGVWSFCQPSWAETKTEEVDVQFTFNSMINVTASASSMSIGSLAPGTVSESEAITVTVSTNNVSGFYLSATSGEKATNTDLTGTNGGKFTHLAQEASLDKGGITDGYWGVRYAVGAADINSSKYTGFPQDKGDNGAGGKKLIDADNLSGDKAVKVQIGAKAAATQAAGTYTNKINFYAVTK